MKLRLLFLLLFPLFAYSQPKRSLAVRKLYDQAVTQYNAGNHAESLKLFEECVAADSTYTEAYLNISYITFDQNNFVKALVNAKKALKYNQFQAPIFIQTGKCPSQIDWARAIRASRKGSTKGIKGRFWLGFAGKSDGGVEPGINRRRRAGCWRSRPRTGWADCRSCRIRDHRLSR